MDVFPFNVVKLGSFLQGHFVPQNGDGLKLGSSRDRKFSKHYQFWGQSF